MNVREYSKKVNDYVIELRRYFHQYPELSMQEFETSKKIQAELDKIGIDYKVYDELGVIARIEGRSKGKTIMLRADMDALGVSEESDFEFKSKHDGVMHACGHDGHMAMLLGAAKILNEIKDSFDGTVVLCFQPSEENGSGAKKVMIDKGNVLDGVDGAFGIHVWSAVPTGKVSIEAGPRMASADVFQITVKGSSGHGSMPHQTVDPILVASEIVVNLQSIVSREINPLDSVVISIGAFNAGDAYNAISDTAILKGTARCFDKKIWADLDKRITRIAKNIASAHLAEVEIDYVKAVGPTVNDPKCSELAQRVVTKLAGEDAVYLMKHTTAAEDFSFYADAVPSCFAFLGIGNSAKKTDAPQHHKSFAIDEDALELGVALHVQYTLDFLK